MKIFKVFFIVSLVIISQTMITANSGQVVKNIVQIIKAHISHSKEFLSRVPYKTTKALITASQNTQEVLQKSKPAAQVAFKLVKKASLLSVIGGFISLVFYANSGN